MALHTPLNLQVRGEEPWGVRAQQHRWVCHLTGGDTEHRADAAIGVRLVQLGVRSQHQGALL